MKFGGGRPETECGAGSTVQATEAVRAWLPGLLQRLGVRILLDAPCGDFNWMAHTDLSGIDYIGIDYRLEHVQKARSRSSLPGLAPQMKCIIHADLVRQRPPTADLILCRDFLQHLPHVRARKVLQNFCDSQARWLLVTSHDNHANSDIDRDGDYRPLNLMEPPYRFPAPTECIDDCGRMLGLWPLIQNGA